MTKAPRKRSVRRDEALLWRHVTEGMAPLDDGTVAIPEDMPPEEPAASGEAIRQTPPPPGPPPPTAQDLPKLEAGTVAGVDKRTAARLRRGQLPIEGRLDLHGLTQTEAHRELGDFLAAAQEDGRRCVLVITGKGRGAEGGGVLRAAVPRWLNEPGQRQRVVVFCHAIPRDGGDGALYVLLRRRK
ncbi:MAG: Smr/MutS family protein [Rhodospirillales bacterium]|jgi:DNA-nicking Smr family endonuclease|nr:Smr/MutS family protein [Rhodospirillales bacterium]MDP6773760.1 Smr/MutS family protein [Rhodospirillales bacterium]